MVDIVALTSVDLVVGENTALTLAESAYIATITPKMSGWFGLDEAAQVAALLGSYKKLSRLSFKVDDFIWEEDGCEVTCFKLSDLTQEQFLLLPDDLVASLAEGAMADAVSALDCDNAEIQRADGIMQSKTGETSHMFRPGHPLRWPVSRKVIDIVAPWLCPHGHGLRRSS